MPLSLVLGSHAEQENFLLFFLPGLALLTVDLPPYPCDQFIIWQSFRALLEAVECFCGSRKLLSRSLTRMAFFFSFIHSMFLHRRVILNRNRRHADPFSPSSNKRVTKIDISVAVRDNGGKGSLKQAIPHVSGFSETSDNLPVKTGTTARHHELGPSSDVAYYQVRPR